MTCLGCGYNSCSEYTPRQSTVPSASYSYKTTHNAQDYLKQENPNHVIKYNDGLSSELDYQVSKNLQEIKKTKDNETDDSQDEVTPSETNLVEVKPEEMQIIQQPVSMEPEARPEDQQIMERPIEQGIMPAKKTAQIEIEETMVMVKRRKIRKKISIEG